MTSAKESETGSNSHSNGADTPSAAAPPHAGEEDELELDPAAEEPEEIPIRVDPLPQQNASPIDIDKGLRLIELCRDGSLLPVKTHISEGSPAGFISKTGWTPLAAAAYSGKSDIVAYLLEIGADMMYKTNRRTNTNANNNNSSVLSDSSSLLHHSNSNSSNASSSTKAPMDPHYGHNNNSRQSSGVNTPLHWASYKGHLDVLSILLHAGYSIEDVDPVGNRCLHLGCSGGHRDVVELLLANSASVDQKNQYGNRPLDLATDPNCRKLLHKFQSQTTCEWCKEAFSRIRRPSLCQHCHNIYCDARPCSSYSEGMASSSGKSAGAGGVFRAMRYCQECANEMGKAEQDLRSLLESKLELIRHTLGLIGSKSDSALGGKGGGRTSRPGSGATSPDANASEAAADGESESPSAAVEGAAEMVITTEAANGEESHSSMALPSEASPTGAMMSPMERQKAWSPLLPHAQRRAWLTEASPLQACEEAHAYERRDGARTEPEPDGRGSALHCDRSGASKSGRPGAHPACEVDVPPTGRACGTAGRDQVAHGGSPHRHPVARGASQERAAARQAAPKPSARSLAATRSARRSRLEASVAEAQVLGVNKKLLGSAVSLRDRLNAEIVLEESLLPFTPKPNVSPETGVETTQYQFSDGTLVLSLLLALELRSQKITAAVEFGTSVEGVSTSLLEEGANILKQLKKDVREEMKNEEERR